ncbi:MAG: hypothetical protein P1T08_13110 [Acidimicrobiia bacterium]|nr:hypothetical protein [Acidimicrobiia bacterium]
MRRAIFTVSALALIGVACGSGTDAVPTVPAVGPTSTVAPAATTTSEPVAGDTTTTTFPATTTTLPGVTVLEVVVAEGEVAELSATLDEELRIIVYADEVDEVHLHTYDIQVAVGPGAPAVIEFVASIPGIFEIEFEKAGSLIAELRVDP